jgi:serine/threonine protein kinase
MSDAALWYVQECEDTLSIASTHVEDDGPNLYAPAGRSPSHCGWRRRGEFDCEMSPTLAHMDSKRSCGAPRTRGSNYVSLNGLGIKPKSPSASAQPSSSISITSMSLPERISGKLSLGERSLPKLTEAFPQKSMWGGRRSSPAESGGGGSSSLCDLKDRFAAHGDDVAWHDHEAMKAKYGGREAAGHGLESAAHGCAHTLTHNSASHTIHNTLHSIGQAKPCRKKDFRFADIVKVAKIGKGNTSVVWQCQDSSTGESLAMKEMTVDRDEKRMNMALRELVTMYGVDHVGVVTCHNVFYANNSFHLMMEHMDGGSLLDAMRRWCPLYGAYSMQPAVLAKVAHDVLSALHFLHEQLQVVHRDVKPGNILLNCEGEAKLADLGIVTQPGEVQVDPQAPAPVSDGGTPATPAIEWIGTVTYMSPERLTGDAYSYSADIWSLGIVLVEAAIGRYPITELALGSNKLEFWDLLDLVRNGECPSKVLRNYGSEWVSLQAFASRCLIKDHTKRPSASQLLDASFPGVVAGGDHFFLHHAQPNGQAALSQWVRQSLVRASRAAGGDDDSLCFDDHLHQQAMLVEEQGLEEDGWL